MSTEELLQGLKQNGVARTNRFRVDINLPSTFTQYANTTETQANSILSAIAGTLRLLNNSQRVQRTLSLMCETTQLPGKSFNTNEMKYNAEQFKVPYSVAFDVQRFVFYSSADLYERSIIDLWMDFILNMETHTIKYMDEYVTNITIHQLDVLDRPIYSIKLIDAYPVQLSPAELSHASQNGVARVDCGFAYKRWEVVNHNKDTSVLGGLEKTIFGPALSEVLTDPYVKKGLDVLKRSGLNLEDEALAVYNQIDDLLSNVTGMSANKLNSLLNSIKSDTAGNDKLSTSQKTQLSDLIDNIISGVKS